MTIDRKEVEHVALLARLRLSPSEVERFTTQLSQVLSYVEKLGELDTADVELTSHVLDMTNVFREDVLRDSTPREEILRNAPGATEEFFRVPRIIET